MTDLASRDAWDELDHQVDLGPLARWSGRRSWPAAVAALGGVAAVAGAVAVLLGAPGWVAVLGAALLVPCLGRGLAPRLRGRLAWTAPSTLYALEVVVVVLLQQAAAPGHWAGAFALSAAAAYRRYDIIYRRRDLGAPPPAWTDVLTLGVEGRVLVVAAAYAIAPSALTAVLLALAALVGAVVAIESTVAWVRWLRRTSVP